LKISTKGRYGLEALVDLALHADEGHVNLKSIADRCGLSETYILQIFLKLRRAGIVESVRGAHGGYKLAKEASELTAGMVLTALEGQLAPVDCIVEDTDQPCDRYENCSTRELWEDIMVTLNNAAGAVTIGDLVACYHQLEIEETMAAAAAMQDAPEAPAEFFEYFL
jgi:Rrf2 family protein